MKVNTGFTLIELMIVVAIVSITLTIGLPSFQSLIASNRLTTSANAMTSALQLARAEALKQHKHVVVIPKGTGWISGWNVFVDTNSNNSIDGSESTFTAFDALSSTLSVLGTLKNATYFYYDESGRFHTDISLSATTATVNSIVIDTTNARFSFCSPSNQDFRSVVITLTGRVRIQSTSSTPSSAYSTDCV